MPVAVEDRPRSGVETGSVQGSLRSLLEGRRGCSSSGAYGRSLRAGEERAARARTEPVGGTHPCSWRPLILPWEVRMFFMLRSNRARIT